MNKIIITLAVVLAILIGLLAFFIIREKTGSEEEPTEISTVETVEKTDTTEATEETEAPTQTDAPETEATEATEESQPATEATEESVIPSVETEPIEGDETNSGQFTSETGTGLDLVVDWKTYTSSDGTKMVRFDVSIKTFSIYVGSRIDGIHITMDGVTKTFDSADVAYPSGGRTTILLGSYVMEMSGNSANVNVAWDFRGTYSGTVLEQVTASGTVMR